MDNRPVLIDLCCKAGGASVGYDRAGFRVIGYDIEPQPRYPYEFHRADLRDLAPVDLLAHRPVAIHASPPCKGHGAFAHYAGAGHLNLIPATRELLHATGLPYVIENVPGAPLVDPVTLCGSMFDLGVRRHRLFELGNWSTDQPVCRHREQNARKIYPVRRYHKEHGGKRVTMSAVVGVYGGGQGLGIGEVPLWRRAMGIEWMVRDELSQAIPPAYTEYLGRELRRALQLSHEDAIVQA